MANDKLTELQKKKRIKEKLYNDTPANSWRKRKYRLELDIINSRIQLETLNQHYQ